MTRHVGALLLAAACAFAISCNDDGDSSPRLMDACGPDAPPECVGNQVPAGITQQPRATIALTPVAPAETAIYDGLPSNELILGDPAAPVTIDMWSNFLCGHCAAFALEIMPPLVTDYVASGRVRFVFHHAPLGGAPAIRAHEASQCAADQGRFWPAFAQLYANFSQKAEAYTDDRLSAMMANAGLDVAAFDACLADGEYRDEIEAAVVAFGEVQRIPNAGVAAATATSQGRPLLPVVIINNRPIVAPTLEEMRAIIEEELP